MAEFLWCFGVWRTLHYSSCLIAMWCDKVICSGWEHAFGFVAALPKDKFCWWLVLSHTQLRSNVKDYCGSFWTMCPIWKAAVSTQKLQSHCLLPFRLITHHTTSPKMPTSSIRLAACQCTFSMPCAARSPNKALTVRLKNLSIQREELSQNSLKGHTRTVQALSWSMVLPVHW